MRLYGLPWTLPPRLGIEDSYFFSSFSHSFCEHLPWASEFPAQHSAGRSDREAVVPVPFLSWGNSLDMCHYIHPGGFGGPEEEGIARQVFWGLPGVVGGG